MNVQAGEKSRIDVYIQLPYSHLRFERQLEGFKASYSMTFIIRDSTNETVLTKEVDRPIFARSYEESVSSRPDVHFQPFIVSPGTYTLEIVSTDNLSLLRYRSKERFQAADFTSPGTIASSLLFLDDADADAKWISLRPILPSAISMLKDSLGIFQELYHVQQNDTITVADRYARQTPEREETIDFPYLMPPYSLRSDRCAAPFDSVYFRSETTFVAQRNGSMPFIRFNPLPGAGASALERTITVRHEGKNDTARFSRTFFRRAHQLRSALSMDETAAAMKFIMRQEEYDSLVAAEGEGRIARLRQFWEPRGGTARKTEFERKVMEANTLFTTCVDGSRTAMGIVYFICGIPDYIDCRGPYLESWYYTIGDRAYAFQFRRDDDRFQHFELTPYSVNESVWQYFVDRWRKKS
jgi:GWxTD domain-containing protein